MFIKQYITSYILKSLMSTVLYKYHYLIWMRRYLINDMKNLPLPDKS